MLYVQEQWVDRTRNCSLGDSDIYESFTDNRGKLFRAMQSEYGRCTGKVYIDRKAGPDDPGYSKTQAIGWVFEKRQKYSDCNETYLAEAWVTVHTAPPTKTIEYHYED